MVTSRDAGFNVHGDLKFSSSSKSSSTSLRSIYAHHCPAGSGFRYVRVVRAAPGHLNALAQLLNAK